MSPDDEAPRPSAAGGSPPGAPPAPKVARRGQLGALVRSRWGGPILLFIALCSWLGTQLALGIVLGVVFVVRAGGKLDQVGLEAYLADQSALLIFASMLAIIVVTLGLRALDALPEPPPRASSRRTAAFVAGGALLCFGGQQAITWLQQWAGLEWSEQDLVAKSLAGDGWLVFALAIVIGAPVGEELVFRCLGYGALRPWTRPVAALLTAFLFAVVHMNASATFLYVWIALCCTIVYEKTGRFAAPMVVHGVNNGVVVAYTLWWS